MTKSPSPSVDEVAERREALLSILRNAVIETAQRVSGRRGPYVFDEAELQGLASELAATAASLVSPPKAAGEFRARIVHCEDCYSQGTVTTLDRYKSMMASPCQNCGAPARALRWVYAVANHEARGDGVRVTDEAAKILIGGHERACVRWATAPTSEDADRIWAEQVKPTQDAIRSALLPPLGDGRAEIVEACAKVADQVRVRLTQQARRGKLNQIDEHVAGIADDIAAAIRSLSNPGGGLS